MLVFHAGLGQLHLLQGDITKLAVDAIVNAANSHLAGGGGVDGAIHSAGGASIMRELDQIRARIGRCPAGSAVATGAGHLPATFIFHAVGPIYRDGQQGEAELLKSCYLTCLNMAAERELSTVSFPSISTGVYSYPIDDAAQIALRSVADWLGAHAGTVTIVKLVQFSREDHAVYRNLAEKMLGKRAAGTSR